MPPLFCATFIARETIVRVYGIFAADIIRSPLYASLIIVHISYSFSRLTYSPTVHTLSRFAAVNIVNYCHAVQQTSPAIYRHPRSPFVHTESTRYHHHAMPTRIPGGWVG